MKTDYDLILMDIQMPVLDGIEAVRQLRAFGNLTPVIALTANVMKDEVEHYLEIGFNAHLGKPINRMALSRELARYLKKADKSQSKQTSFDSEVAALREKYLANQKAKLNEIKGLIQDKNFEGLSYIAHAIKGSASTFEFAHLAQLATELERLAEAKDQEALVAAEELIKAIQAQSI